MKKHQNFASVCLLLFSLSFSPVQSQTQPPQPQPFSNVEQSSSPYNLTSSPRADSEIIGLSSVTVEQIAMDYLRYNFEIVNALTNSDEDEEQMSMLTSYSSENLGRSDIPGMSSSSSNSSPNASSASPSPSPYYLGSSAGSSFGMGHILAIIKENIWPVSTAAFEGVMRESPDYLTEIYQLLLTTMSEDKEFDVSLSIYTADKISAEKQAMFEILNTTVIPMSFNDADSAVNNHVEKINSDIMKHVEDKKFKENYIAADKKLPRSTKAMLVHTLSYMENWPQPWKRIGKRSFNGQKEIEMMEIAGNFPYLESDRALEVSIPVTKNDSTRILSLILPRNIEDALNGNLGVAKNGTAKWTRIQMPIFDFNFRVPHHGGVGGSQCNFERKENFMNVLDDLTFISFEPEKISAVAVTGVQVNNVAEYKEELRASLASKRLKRHPQQSSVESSSTTPNNSTGSISNSNSTASTSDKSQESISVESDQNQNAEKKTVDPNDEKLIIFDRPFTWTIIDDSLFSTPIFSGAIESFPQGIVDLTKATGNIQNNNSVFGLDRTIRYLNCL